MPTLFLEEQLLVGVTLYQGIEDIQEWKLWQKNLKNKDFEDAKVA